MRVKLFCQDDSLSDSSFTNELKMSEEEYIKALNGSFCSESGTSMQPSGFGAVDSTPLKMSSCEADFLMDVDDIITHLANQDTFDVVVSFDFSTMDSDFEDCLMDMVGSHRRLMKKSKDIGDVSFDGLLRKCEYMTDFFVEFLNNSNEVVKGKLCRCAIEELLDDGILRLKVGNFELTDTF